MDKASRKERRNFLLTKRKNKRKLSVAEMNAERMALRYETIEMFEKGYISDFVYRVSKKYGWINEGDKCESIR